MSRQRYSLRRCIDGGEGGLSLADGRYVYVQVVGFPLRSHFDSYAKESRLSSELTRAWWLGQSLSRSHWYRGRESNRIGSRRLVSWLASVSKVRTVLITLACHWAKSISCSIPR